jgi:precorrin-6Y C5,15-methyltransferase (decarboxylating)
VVIFALAACPSSTINLEDLPVIGLPNQVIASFPDRPGLMTKREIRVIALAQLDLRPHQVIWDIGSGTGSVAIEIARVCPTATIYAIEKTLVGFNLINENRHRFEVTDQVQAVQGAAPAILEHLPDPDRVFIGGSGGNLEAILNMLNTIMGRCTKANKIIVALTTLENLNVSLDWVKRHGCAYELLQIQINKSIPIATSHRLNPQNPVYLITIHSEPSPPPSQ